MSNALTHTPQAYNKLATKIVRTSLFERSLRKLGASTGDLEKLERAIAANPEIGDVIQDCTALARFRFSMAGRGKRGGGRAIYVLVVKADAAYLLLAYSKGIAPICPRNSGKCWRSS